MARARASDNPRSRSKAALIDEIGRGIEQFHDILTSIEDFSRDGFPYRDAARAKAELQLRECVRRIFGERSQEFQTYRNHKLRVSSKAETGQSVALVKRLIQELEDKKLELQGLKPAAPEPAATNHSTAPPPLSLVPPLPPAAQVTLAPQQAATSPPMTVSVAMTTNLGMPAVPVVPAQPPSVPPSPSQTQAMTPQPAPPVPPSMPPMPPAPLEQPQSNLAPAPSAPISVPIAAPAVTELIQTPPPASADTSAAAAQKRSAPEPAAVQAPSEPAAQRAAPADSRFADPLYKEDSLELIRKVCLRFHAVTRQLRLRKDYRATLEVEDDYDLQDLLCALLKVEFEEVGLDEWIPPYTNGAPRTAFLLHRDQIAVVAKKTRPGLTMKELADQVTADSAYYGTRERCTTLFCFIYDPEGRIGSPKRLETDLTSVSDRYMIEVLVAPK